MLVSVWLLIKVKNSHFFVMCVVNVIYCYANFNAAQTYIFLNWVVHVSANVIVAVNLLQLLNNLVVVVAVSSVASAATLLQFLKGNINVGEGQLISGCPAVLALQQLHGCLHIAAASRLPSPCSSCTPPPLCSNCTSALSMQPLHVRPLHAAATLAVMPAALQLGSHSLPVIHPAHLAPCPSYTRSLVGSCPQDPSLPYILCKLWRARFHQCWMWSRSLLLLDATLRPPVVNQVCMCAAFEQVTNADIVHWPCIIISTGSVFWMPLRVQLRSF